MKPRTIQTLRRTVNRLKAGAMWSGHYPPPYDAKAYDTRGPVPFRSMGYASAVIEINALIDAINELTKQTTNQP